MTNENLKAVKRGQSGVQLLASLKNDWLAGVSSDADFRDGMKGVSFKDAQAAGLEDIYDDISQVGCVIEWLAISGSVGGDEPGIVRRYAMDSWERGEVNDPFFLLPDSTFD